MRWQRWRASSLANALFSFLMFHHYFLYIMRPQERCVGRHASVSEYNRAEEVSEPGALLRAVKMELRDFC